MTEWKDATSYSRGERGTKEPSVMEMDLDGLRVSVHRLHGVEGLWFGSCYVMGVERHQLDSKDFDTAAQEFLGYLEGRAQRWVSKLNSVRPKAGTKRKK